MTEKKKNQSKTKKLEETNISKLKEKQIKPVTS
jgi:hypothetical protein